jgi:hypothetical protein
MTVRATMAGLVGMDSPFPPGGVVNLSTLLEETAKIAIEVALNEKTLREIQAMLMRLALSGGGTSEALANEALNFLEKVILQAHMDRSEWLRAQALVNGAINWEHNGKTLTVDYGIPDDNMLTERTGNDAYGGSTSQFWTDVRTAQRLLRFNLQAIIMNPLTLDTIIYNDANSAQIISQTDSVFRIQRLRDIGGNTVTSTEARDTIALISYDREGEVLDLTKPGQTVKVPFMPAGKVLFVGGGGRSGYRVGEGSTDDPNAELALGYHHLAPTVEGQGRPGRWAELYTPQGAPYSLHGRGASNELPVIEAPQKIVVATTEMPA